MSSLRIVSFLIVVLAGVDTSPQCAAGIFLTGRTYPSGVQPVAAVVQDFNNDGLADIASANEFDQNVSVFLGTPHAGFDPANTFSVGAGAVEISSADLNRDGNGDLVVTDGIRSVYVVLGNGDGTFGSSTKVKLHNDPIGIAIADLNGDSILDLAIANFGPETNSQGEAAILIGVGDGTFAPPVFYPLTHNGIRLVATDVNHDGKADLAVAVTHFSITKNSLAVLLGNGDGTFQPVVTSVHGSGSDVVAADFNADGNIDLALSGDGDLRIVLGKGDGTFQPATIYSAGGSADSVSAADFNHDGVLDLLVGGDHTVIFLGNGDGSFAAPVVYGAGYGFARIGYFNRDQDPDVVVGAGSAIEVVFGRANGTLGAPRSFPGGNWGFDAGDFDRDGQNDIIDGSPLTFLRGIGDGTLAEGVPLEDVPAKRLIATDFNGDGNLDLLASPFYPQTGILTLLGNGDGTFQTAQFTDMALTECWPVAADFNHDGKIDVAATSGQLAILLGRGDGTFQPAIYYSTDPVPQSPVAADFNLDGNPDLAISHTFDAKVSIFLGHGDGTFDPPLTIASPGALYLSAGDVNRDGKPDLVVAGGLVVNLFLGNGDGTFQQPQSIYSDYGPVTIADVDRDGRADVMLWAETSFRIVVLRGKGDGTFGAGVELPYTGDFVLSDLNGDNKPEAIVSAKGFNILLNTTRSNRAQSVNLGMFGSSEKPEQYGMGAYYRHSAFFPEGESGSAP